MGRPWGWLGVGMAGDWWDRTRAECIATTIAYVYVYVYLLTTKSTKIPSSHSEGDTWPDYRPPEGREHAPHPRRLLHKVHLPFRGPWPRASPRATKPGRGSTRTVHRNRRSQTPHSCHRDGTPRLNDASKHRSVSPSPEACAATAPRFVRPSKSLLRTGQIPRVGKAGPSIARA